MDESSYIKSMLDSFTLLDINKLRYLLKNEYTYSETTKEIFLNEIETIFAAHRNSGDTELLLYQGVCNGRTCENCGKKGYRFVGNNTKNYLDLIFEIEGDEIKDIYSCAEFKSETEIQGLGERSSIDIIVDDYVSFKKNPNYWAKVYSAQDAYNELITNPPRHLSFGEMKYWIEKHAELYDRLGGYKIFSPQMRWTPFLKCYCDLKELVSFISENLEEIMHANRLIGYVKTEQELIDWVLKYETVYEKGTLDLLFMVVENGDEIYFKRAEQYSFRGDCFVEAMKFLDSFLDKNTELLVKYSVFTAEEEEELYSGKNRDFGTNNIDSLRFHIEQRKAFEDMGISLPFYLKEETKSA
ncbi:MAG: hypothetical protein CVU00_02660 [Bacteroidetes bacterium HGW-Bacteroidetes-17]|jgi:hypothetical protein|nr:MAG: hypothetical protein CVU00_02660 [Bacteroidetes bacterium HGW-Bacteroidetes-17]